MPEPPSFPLIDLLETAVKIHMEDEVYKYEPLAARHIRLLSIANIDSKPECARHHYSLQEVAGQYYALSYAWGTDSITLTIRCNGKLLYVTPNLYETLQQLFLYKSSPPEGFALPRFLGGKKHIREWLIWIDAICLNQQDPQELSVQVPIMNEIYSGAHKTLAYLGASADGSDLTMTSIAQINSKLQRVIGVILTSMLPRLGLEQRDHLVWRALDDMFHRQWFKRLGLYKKLS
jgi:hypothetical protein